MTEKISKEEKKKLLIEAIKQYEEALIQKKEAIKKCEEALGFQIKGERMIMSILGVLKESK